MTHWDYSMDIIVHGNLSGKKCNSMYGHVWSFLLQWSWTSGWNGYLILGILRCSTKNLRGEDALWCSSKVLTCEWSIPGYLDTCCITQLLIIIWPSIEWRCHRSRFTEGDIVILLLLHVIVVCLMCVPCGNSLKNSRKSLCAWQRQLRSHWRRPIWCKFRPCAFFRWASLLLTFVFSRHRMSDGQTFFPAKRWTLENHLARFIGIIWWLSDRSQCRGQVIVASGLIALGAFTPDFRQSAVKPASQPLRPWQTYGIAIESQKEGKKHENIILTWCSLPFPATSVFFTKNYCTGLMLT